MSIIKLVSTRVVDSFNYLLGQEKSIVENAKIINRANITVMAWVVNALLSEKSIKGLDKTGTAFDSVTYNTDYFDYVIRSHSKMPDIIPKEDTDVHKEFLDLINVENPVPLESADIDLSAIFLNKMLEDKGKVGILTENTKYRDIISYDSRYFQHHDNSDGSISIYPKTITEVYQDLRRDEEFISEFKLTGKSEEWIQNSVLNKDVKLIDLILKIKGLTGLHCYSKDDALVTIYNPDKFESWKRKDEKYILVPITTTEEYEMLMDMKKSGWYDALNILTKMGNEYKSDWSTVKQRYIEIFNNNYIPM